MKTVKITEGKFISPLEEKLIVSKDEGSEIIWEKKGKLPARRFTAADLWNIRKNARRFNIR